MHLQFTTTFPTSSESV